MIRQLLRDAREWAGDRLAVMGLVLCILWMWIIGGLAGLEEWEDWPGEDLSAAPRDDGRSKE